MKKSLHNNFEEHWFLKIIFFISQFVINSLLLLEVFLYRSNTFNLNTVNLNTLTTLNNIFNVALKGVCDGIKSINNL